ncbi:MAG: PilZ domain-containing protein [Planctomycetota bacterium]|jgi:hypothetical protein
MQTIDRRQHDRFELVPMYTAVTVQRVTDLRMQTCTGHAYDLSESGVRLELDEALDKGERVTTHLGLPGEQWTITATAEVIWVGDADDDPGPRRAALRFVAFPSSGDRSRLLRFLGSGIAPRAA